MRNWARIVTSWGLRGRDRVCLEGDNPSAISLLFILWGLVPINCRGFFSLILCPRQDSRSQSGPLPNGDSGDEQFSPVVIASELQKTDQDKYRRLEKRSARNTTLERAKSSTSPALVGSHMLCKVLRTQPRHVQVTRHVLRIACLPSSSA